MFQKALARNAPQAGAGLGASALAASRAGHLRRSRIRNACKKIRLNRSLARFCKSLPRGFEVARIEVESDKTRRVAFARSERGISDADKRIEHSEPTLIRAVQAKATLRECDRKCGRMRPFALAIQNRFVRNKPRITSAAPIRAAGVTPSCDVRFIRVFDADTSRAAMDRNIAHLCEVEDEFVAIVHVSRRIDRLEMTDRLLRLPRRVDGDRLYPVERVLQNEDLFIGNRDQQSVRKQRLRWRAAEV